MTVLALAALAWVVLHMVVAGPLRPALVGRLGLPAYRGLFSLLSAASLAALIWAYGRAPAIPLWPGAPPGLVLVPVMVMPVALLLLVAGLRPTNPTLAGPDMMLKGALPVQGIIKVTRHPMLWAFALWAASHMAANLDLATWLLAGAILLTSLSGMRSIDRKRAKQFGQEWDVFISKTSIIPFLAAAQNRVRLRAADFGWGNLGIAAVLYGILLWAHEFVFGVPAVS